MSRLPAATALGWYRSLVADGPATAADLAARTATHPRYAREWLEQQAVTGLLAVDDPTTDGPTPASTRSRRPPPR